MNDLIDLLVSSLPDAVGGLIATAIIVIVGALYNFIWRKKRAKWSGDTPKPTNEESPELTPVKGRTLDEEVDKVKELVTTSRYQQAVKLAKQIRQEMSSLGHSPHPDLLLSLGELNVWYAHALIYTGATDEALLVLRNEVISPLEPLGSTYEGDQIGFRRWNLVLGRAHNHIGYANWMDWGHNEAALVELHRAIDYFKKGQHKEELATGYDNLGRIYCQIGFQTRGSFLIKHGMSIRRELANQSGDDYRYALSLNSSAVTHLLTGRPHMALQEGEKACYIFQQQLKMKGKRGYGLALITKGRALRYIGANWRYGAERQSSSRHIQEAILVLTMAERIFSEDVDEDIRLLEVHCELGRAHRELAALWKDSGDTESALREAKQAQKYLSRVIESPSIDTRKKYPVLFVDACHDLGQVFHIIGDGDQAKSYLRKALDAIPPDYRAQKSLGFLMIPSEKCIEEYWQVLGKVHKFLGEMSFNDRLPRSGFPAEAIEQYALAAGCFGRFLGRPLNPENASVYPPSHVISELQLENHRLFVQHLYTVLMTFPEPVLVEIKDFVYNTIGAKYHIDASWLDPFFSEPFALLLHH